MKRVVTLALTLGVRVSGAVQGANHTGKLGYYGPHPPSGEPPHHYHFQIFAPDTVLKLPPGFDRHALIDAMRGRVLAKGELVGTYRRRPQTRAGGVE